NFTSPDEVIETLEIVLHRGKIENRGGIVEYNPEIDSKLEVAKLLDKQIFLGFAIKEEKIVPYFQPIFDLNTGKIFAYEVLFRIEDNGRALPAGDYIDVAYKTGLIVEIDKTVLNYLKGNLDKLEGFNLFINISAPFVKDKDFLELTPDICNCVYEITEQIAVDNIDKLKNLVKNSNVKMALDDFGSGYSSIKTVVELTTGGVINYLKIDGSLIKDLNKSKENFYIVESVVKMAKTLGLKTVAEFIENEEILKTVKQLGIDYAQGFYLGKPKPLSEIIMLEHFYNKEYFLKQLKRELARVKRYKRNLSILRIDIKNNVPDDDIFIFAESISNNLRITDLFVKWDKHTLLIAAPEISKENAKGIERKVLNLSKELSKKNKIFPVEISAEIFEITPKTKIEDEKKVINGVLGELKFEEKV
ncbi:EAL domain-containing protein, partial [Hydrogenivirga sp. 128-5-R1-1]|uniref:EAL domain-containing protein n=1 Tax=Hydrogenivirga sp. 128-5-R1-1 TaxID=392423 RepID=UPI00015EFF14